MKRIFNILCLILFLFLSILMIMFRNEIKFFMQGNENYEYDFNKVYLTGEEVIVEMVDKVGYNPYIYVGYIDKDNKLLDFHAVNLYMEAYVEMLSFKVGDVCEETLEDYWGESYKTNSELRNFCLVDKEHNEYFNYNKYSKDMKKIKEWKLLDNQNKSMYDYCMEYDIEHDVCNFDYNWFDSQTVLLFVEHSE